MVQLASRHAPDRAKFEGIYLEHHAFVGRCLARLGVPPAGLDDARQDVFLTAFRRLHTYAGQASMRAWLAGIARRVAWRHRRSAQRHQRKVDALALVGSDPASLEEWIRTREAQAVLDAFIDALDPAKREAFVLCELEGLSAREAASATGVNAATLYSRLRVARSSFASMCETLGRDGIGVQPRHAAAIHREAHREEPRAAARGWLLLAPKLASASLLAKPLLLAMVGLGTVGLGTAGYVAADSMPSASIEPVLASARPPTVRPHSDPEAPASPPTRTAQPPPSDPPVAPQPVRRRPAPDPVPEMVEQLAEAQSRLSAGAWSEAAQHAEAHLSRWPEGPLAEDALQVAVRARCKLGSRDQARALAETHLRTGEDVQAWFERRCGNSQVPIMKPQAAGD